MSEINYEDNGPLTGYTLLPIDKYEIKASLIDSTKTLSAELLSNYDNLNLIKEADNKYYITGLFSEKSSGIINIRLGIENYSYNIVEQINYDIIDPITYVSSIVTGLAQIPIQDINNFKFNVQALSGILTGQINNEYLSLDYDYKTLNGIINNIGNSTVEIQFGIQDTAFKLLSTFDIHIFSPLSITEIPMQFVEFNSGDLELMLRKLFYTVL